LGIAVLENTSADMVLRPATGAIFALLDGRSVLFSETRQEIYEPDQVGAFIWCKLAQGASLEVVHQGRGRLGIDEHAARDFTWQAMNVWIDRGLLDLDRRMSANCAFATVLGQRRISIRAANWDLLQQLISLCVPGDSGGEEDIAIETMVLDDQVFFRGNERASINVKPQRWHLRSRLTSPSDLSEAISGFRAPRRFSREVRHGLAAVQPTGSRQVDSCTGTGGRWISVCRR
jgi:hypothetical protein